MSTLTTNYGLVKPALTDSPPDITVMNPNWDRIDDELKNHSSQLAQKVNIGDDYRPNLLANGDFNVWSGATSGIPILMDTTVTDKWVSASIQGISGSKLSTGGVRISNTSAFTYNSRFHQKVILAPQLKGKTVTFSIKAKCSIANKKIGLACTNNVTKFGKEITLTQIEEIYTLTGTLPTDVDEVFIGIGMSTSVPVYWGLTENTPFPVCDIDIIWAKLELNDHATPLIPKSYKQELLDCSDNLGYIPNLLINGDFQIWQRGTSFTPSNGGIYMMDRWSAALSAGFAGKYDKTTEGVIVTPLIAGATVSIAQKIENGYYLKGKTLTVSVNIGGTIYSRTFVVPDNVPVEQEISTTANDKLYMIIQTYTSDSSLRVVVGWKNVTVNTTKTINWVKAELNDYATPFIPRSYGEELALCQRYYEKGMFNIIGAGDAVDRYIGQLIIFVAEKRVAPTIGLGTASENANVKALDYVLITKTGLRAYITTNAAGNAYYSNTYYADAEL